MSLCLGTAVKAFAYEGVGHGGEILLLVCGLAGLFRCGWPFAAFVGVWGVVRMAALVRDAVWHPEIIPFGCALRVLGPISLALLGAFPENVKPAFTTLRLGIASVFCGHGLEALLGQSEFVDLIMLSGLSAAGIAITESTARDILFGIGLLDLAVAAAFLLPMRLRAVAAWAAIWGLLTAASRMVALGAWNYPETLVRVIHGAAPMALLLAWRRKPKRP